MDDNQPITVFRDDFFFLSNFFPSPLVYEGETYPTAEHAFQAAKTLDKSEREKVLDAATPTLAKRLGKRVTLRPGWDTLRFSVMEEILRVKFADPTLTALLAATGNRELIEGNTWRDTTWGCIQTKDGTWKGRNELGKLLMKIRSELPVR